MNKNKNISMLKKKRKESSDISKESTEERLKESSDISKESTEKRLKESSDISKESSSSKSLNMDNIYKKYNIDERIIKEINNDERRLEIVLKEIYKIKKRELKELTRSPFKIV